MCLSEARDTTVLPCRHMCMCSGCARQGLPDIARHVIDKHFEPSFHEPNDILRRGEQYLLLTTSSTRFLNPRCLGRMASYDVASHTCVPLVPLCATSSAHDMTPVS